VPLVGHPVVSSAKPPHVVGFVIVLVVSVCLGRATELAAVTLEHADSHGILVQATALMLAREPGNGLLFVAAVVLADAASSAWIVRSACCV
jgi:hypothetical protein